MSLDERIELVAKLYKQALKRSELRDELFAQISKQTRNCPDRYVIKEGNIYVFFIVIFHYYYFSLYIFI